MKKFILKSLLLAFCAGLGYNATAQFKIRNDEFMQIGYEDYRVLTFGIESNSPNNGKYAIEYWSESQGLNFWKPWPTPGAVNYVLFLRDDNNVGIGTQGASGYKLDVNGKVRANGYVTASDSRLKGNVQNLNSSLSKIMLLRPVSYHYNYNLPKYDPALSTNASTAKQQTMSNDATLTTSADKHLGFLAQEVQTVLPELVETDDDGYLSLNYVEIIPLLVDGIKEQQATIDGLERRLAMLEGAGTNKNRNGIETDVDNINDAEGSKLYQNTPNPFDKTTNIKYQIAENEKISSAFLQIHDAKGVLLESMVLKTLSGTHTIEVDLSNAQNGVYFYSLVLNGAVVDAQRMVLKQGK